MDIKPTQSQEEFERSIYQYCEIIYNALQSDPSLYNELLPKSTFKLKAIDGIPVDGNSEYKIAA